jgi:rhodanese-related sulfurtransferase
MKRYFLIVATALFIVNTMCTALAVPPPDFLFNVGAQIAQAFSFIAVLLSAFLVGFRQYAKVFYMTMKHKNLFWIGSALVVVGISFVGAYFYGQYSQNVDYQQWIAESQKQDMTSPITDYSLDKLKIKRPDTSIQQGEIVEQPTVIQPAIPAVIRPVAPLEPVDPNAEFIKTYYQNIGTGNLEAAYSVSKKQVSLDTFKSWYKDTDSASVDDIQKIDDNNYSLRIGLTEKDIITTYAVLMTLKIDSQELISIADSKSRVLSSAPVVAVNTLPTKTPSTVVPSLENSQTNDKFFEDNKSLPLAITNVDFKLVTNSGKNIFVLDAREDEEFGIGYFPGSTHIKFADLVAGEWIKLPTDQVIYVFCWSGIRGQEVATFLREKKIVSRYVKTGADGWVTFGGKWTGGIKFSSKYTADQYSKLFDLNTLKKQMAAGVAIVDSRIANKYDAWHIPGSINIPIIYTPTSQIDALMAQVPTGVPVITVCDDFVSCFDAKITGVKLEKRGHQFLGRYNKPWEYRSNQ